MKKLISYILLSIYLFSTGNFTLFLSTIKLDKAEAATQTWDFNILGDYTRSSTTALTISGSVMQLKKNTLAHEGVYFNATLMNGSYDSVVDGNYAYVTNYLRDSVSIIDISNPVSPSYVTQIVNNNGTIRLNGAAGIVKEGNYLYVASQVSDALQIIDVSNPANPVQVGQVLNTTTTRLNGARGIAKSGNYVYIASDTDDALTVVNVSNPAAPTYVGKYYVANGNLNGARDVKIVGNYAFVASYNRDALSVVDISNPASPTYVTQLRQTTRLNGAHNLEISGDYAYVSAYLNASVMVIDISNPASLVEVTNISGGSYSLTNPRDLLVDGNNLFITSYGNDAVNIVDISNPISPVYVNKVLHNAANPRLDGADGLFKVGDFLYVASYISDALEILEFQYDTTSPFVTPVTAFNYGTDDITAVNETLGAGNQGTITYQISKNGGSTWYYWNGAAWSTTVAGVVNSNSVSVINANLTSFNALAGGTGNFSFKVFFTSNGNQKVELDSIAVISTAFPILGVTYSDNDTDNSVIQSQVVKYTTSIANTGANATGISAVAPIDTNFGTPYGFSYANCGSPTSSFSSGTLTFSNISILGGNTCTLIYYIQVNAGAPNGANITSSIDVSAAIEGGNNPASISADTLTVLACGINDVSVVFETDSYGEDIFWSLAPNGNTCGVGEISNGGNPGLNCTSGGAPATAGAGDPYADNVIITEGPYSLTVGNQYDLHVIDDYGDGITVGAGGTDPDIRIRQNGVDTDTFNVLGNGGVFTFTVQQPTACIDTLSPEVTINQAPTQADPALTNSATYKVVFNEPINTGTFTSTDITLSGTTGTITSGPTQVAPNNGTSFEFTVTGMTLFNTVTATIPAGGITDIAGNLSNASTSIDNQITYDPGDITPPTITGTNFASGSLLPSGSHNIVIDYFDSESGIDTGSAIFELYKWNGSSWGTNIASGNIGTPTISATHASYPTLDLDYGKYLFAFQISDNAENSSSTGGVLYIDRPLFTVSTPEIDIGNIGSFSESFSSTVTLTVETVGAAFEVRMNRKTDPLYDTESIQSFDGTSGYGYRPSPLTGSLQTIGVNEIIASQVQNINTNGNRNTYNYEIQLGALIDILQASGDYEGKIDFGIEFEY